MPIEQIDPLTLQHEITQGRVILIDVREPDEYEAASIDGAALIPMGQCYPPSLPVNPDKKIVFHCKRGGRSQRVCEAYAAAHPDVTVYNLAGGMDAWIAHDLPHRSKG